MPRPRVLGHEGPAEYYAFDPDDPFFADIPLFRVAADGLVTVLRGDVPPDVAADSALTPGVVYGYFMSELGVFDVHAVGEQVLDHRLWWPHYFGDEYTGTARLESYRRDVRRLGEALERAHQAGWDVVAELPTGLLLGSPAAHVQAR